MKKILIATLVVVALSLTLVAAVAAQVPEDDVLSGEQCKMCHPEEHEVWAGTGHPNSLTAVKDSGHGSEDCLHCMSADYRWNEELTLETAQYGVTCVACHTPHDTPGDEMPAIADVGALCKECHNAEVEAGATAEAGTTLRHAVTEMMGGYGAINAEGSASAHDIACNTCHLQGHLYVPEQSTCDNCHGGAVTIEEAGAPVRAFVENTMAIEGLADGWPAAYTNVSMLSSDDSGGIHNMSYANAIVAATEALLEAEPMAAEEPAEEEEAMDIVDTAIAAGSFNTLVSAVQAADLVDALKGEGPFTVFAPTDDAFDALPAGTLDALVADPSGDLTDILLYHVLSGKVMAEAVTDGLEAETLQGASVTFSVTDEGAMINGAKIISTDIETSNGVIHVIDAVLLPPEEGAAPAEEVEEAAPVEELPDTGGVPLMSGPALLLLTGTLTLAGGFGTYIWTRRK